MNRSASSAGFPWISWRLCNATATIGIWTPLWINGEALEEKVGRVVCYEDILSWFSEPIFERPVTLH
jgi:hypothetical protein